MIFLICGMKNKEKFVFIFTETFLRVCLTSIFEVLPKTGLSLDYLEKFPSKMFEWVLNTPSLSQPAFTCTKLTIETLEQDVEYVQS